MQEVIQSPPKTILEVYQMLPEGTRAELINGILYMSPAPNVDHQNTVFSLAGQFYNFIIESKSGQAFLAPIDVFFDERNAFQPDLAFVTNKNTSIVKHDGIHGAPDLIIEIISPGSKNIDLIKKKKVYEKAGVKEYWIINPTSKECTGFQLKKEKFEELKKEKRKIVSVLLKHTFKF